MTEKIVFRRVVSMPETAAAAKTKLRVHGANFRYVWPKLARSLKAHAAGRR